MNTDQYTPAMDNTFACDVYRKGYLQNQHMQEFQLIQNERNSYSEHTISQAVSNNSKQLMPGVANAFPGSVNVGDFTQNHHWQENCQVRTFGDEGYSQFVKTSTEHFNQAVANHFPCDIYGKEFSKNPDFQDLSHSKPKLNCDKCKKKFAKSKELIAHHCLQVSQASFTCDICKNEFSEKSVFKKHQLLHTLEQPFACALCGCRFSSLPDLTIHLEIHSEVEPSPSEVIEKRPICKEGLNSSHTAENAREKRFICDICEKRFGYKQGLDDHKLTHTEERPHTCELCEKRFKSKKYLHRHYQKVHLGEHPYACDQCDKKYKDKHSLKYHLLRHSGEKPFHCDKCTQKFTQKSHLRNHQKVHTGEKPFSCPVCPVKYSNREYFLKHVQRHNEQNDSQTGKINSEQCDLQKEKRSAKHSQKVQTRAKKSNKKSIRLVYLNFKPEYLASKTNDGQIGKITNKQSYSRPGETNNEQSDSKPGETNNEQSDSRLGETNSEQGYTHTEEIFAQKSNSQKVSEDTKKLNKKSSQVVKVTTSKNGLRRSEKDQVRWKVKFV